MHGKKYNSALGKDAVSAQTRYNTTRASFMKQARCI